MNVIPAALDGAARRRGLAARHANKLRRLAEAEQRQDDEQQDH